MEVECVRSARFKPNILKPIAERMEGDDGRGRNLRLMRAEKEFDLERCAGEARKILRLDVLVIDKDVIRLRRAFRLLLPLGSRMRVPSAALGQFGYQSNSLTVSDGRQSFTIFSVTTI